MNTLDPFAALENTAKRMAAEKAAAKAMSLARCKLVLGKDAKATFFASIALGLRPEIDWNISTMATDGKRLSYNPDFVNGLSPDERIGVVCHECLHIAHAHHARREGRDHAAWNAACDRAINSILRDAGFKLPEGALFPHDIGMDDGKAAESYYQAPGRSKSQPDNGQPNDGQPGQPGRPGDDPGGCGAVLDAGDAAECKVAEAEAKVTVAQAKATAAARGELPGCLGDITDEIIDPTVPWEQVLQEFVSRSVEARDDYSWEEPDRAYTRYGLYLPSLHSEGLGEIVCHIDISGSTMPYRERFAGELCGVLNCRPSKLWMVYGDTEVKLVEEWTPNDGEITVKVPRDGGGTCHDHLLDWLQESGIEPDCIVCLTDGQTWLRDEPPAAPVLWVITPGGSTDLPFGRVIEMAE